MSIYKESAALIVAIGADGDTFVVDAVDSYDDDNFQQYMIDNLPGSLFDLFDIRAEVKTPEERGVYLLYADATIVWNDDGCHCFLDKLDFRGPCKIEAPVKTK